MTRREINGVVEAFTAAGKRAKEAGFDAVELHGAHGYLISQFISSLFNKRTDEYGGDVRRRARFVLEIVTGIKTECGHDYPVIVRVNGEEYEEGESSLKIRNCWPGCLKKLESMP
jgi:2,4-dienoyl-CoA reductase-like NADH-dependent reductase (Old Yellow Enzyme family)